MYPELQMNFPVDVSYLLRISHVKFLNPSISSVRRSSRLMSRKEKESLGRDDATRTQLPELAPLCLSHHLLFPLTPTEHVVVLIHDCSLR